MTNKSHSLINRTVFYSPKSTESKSYWTIKSVMKCKCACHNKVRLNFVLESLKDGRRYGGMCKSAFSLVDLENGNLLQDLAALGL